LKKRSKKLLSVSGSAGATRGARRLPEIDKSLFASFSSEKEESLP
jgi:hypothetical protein